MQTRFKRNTTLETEHAAALTDTLARLSLSAMLTGYAPRQHVTRRVSWHEFERFIQSQGYEIIKEDGNAYGRVGVRPATPTAPATLLRMVMRSDVAAIYSSRRAV